MKRARRSRRAVSLVPRDLEGAAGVMFPTDVVAPLTAPEHGLLRIEFTVEGDEGATPFAEVALTRRNTGRDGDARWWGESSDGLLAVRLDGQPEGGWSVNLRGNGTPERIRGRLRMLKVLQTLKGASHIGWSVPGGPQLTRGSVGPSTLRIEPGYERYLQALGRVAEHVGEDLRVPDVASADHVHDVVVAAALLDGYTVRGRLRRGAALALQRRA